jgi:hypothetical protein
MELWFNAAQAVGAVATAIGVFFAYKQLRLTRRQQQTDFEDGLTRQFRAVIAELPIGALLGEALPDEPDRGYLMAFYRYIDLTNEQIFLRRQNRVSKETWKTWCDGIRAFLSRPAIERAWLQIEAAVPDSFHELRRLIAEGFETDPRGWPPESASHPSPTPAETRSTTPGFVNANGQEVVRKTELPGNLPGQKVYVLRCETCKSSYGANGCDIHIRRCPSCQKGAPGLAIV